ncbi:hypothetical protein [Kitasatospora aureofaciens]|nr:hypothetical protein [Kitasatospora aureofaciens]
MARYHRARKFMEVVTGLWDSLAAPDLVLDTDRRRRLDTAG